MNNLPREYNCDDNLLQIDMLMRGLISIEKRYRSLEELIILSTNHRFKLETEWTIHLLCFDNHPVHLNELDQIREMKELNIRMGRN